MTSPRITPSIFKTSESQDRAILIMAILRLTRKPGVKGVGPNRDDHPLFTNLCNKWAAGETINRDDLYAARMRVVKYHRQVTESAQWRKTIKWEVLLEQYRANNRDLVLERELQDHLQEANGYGGW